VPGERLLSAPEDVPKTGLDGGVAERVADGA
jgi:hypothetical protein